MDGMIRADPARDQQEHILFFYSRDMPKTQAHRKVAALFILQRIIPLRMVDVYGPEDNPVFPGIDDQLGRLIKAHRQAVEDSAGKYVGVVAFDPGRDINQEGEAHRVAFREAIASESFDLPEYFFG